MEELNLSNEIIVKNQSFGAGVILSLFSSLILLAYVFFPFFKSNEDDNKAKSLSRAQSLAYQIIAMESKEHRISQQLEHELKQEQIDSKSSSRAIASIDENETQFEAHYSEARSIGSDPWGQPYQYRIKKSGTQTFVEVWTTGENSVRTEVSIPEGYL